MAVFGVYERTESGRLSWKFDSSSSMLMGGSSLGPLELMSAYKDRETAERAAERHRERNAQNVEATKRRRKHKTEPATYVVVDASDWQQDRGWHAIPPWPKGAFDGFMPPAA
jgi:hypothetical protein